MSFASRLLELKKNKDTSNFGTKWTIVEDNKLVQEIIDKKTYEEIALEHKRTVLSIKSRVISHVIYPKYKDTFENDIEHISFEFKLDSEIILKYLNKIKTNESIKKIVQDDKTVLEYLQQFDNKINVMNSKLDKVLNSLNLTDDYKEFFIT